MVRGGFQGVHRILAAKSRPGMSVHSHAVAPESSGAFFLDMGTERCVFQAGGLRNALRASEAVRATDVMVNIGGIDRSRQTV